MNPKTPGQHGSPLKVEEEITAIRNRTATRQTLKSLYRKCIAWLRRLGPPLSKQDLEDAVAQAICEVLDALRLSATPVEEACQELRRALNRNRARARSLAERYRNYKISEEFGEAIARFQEVDIEARLDAKNAYNYMLEVVQFLKQFLLLAIEMLPARDYAILYATYRLETIGMKPRGESPLPHLLPNARKVAVFRARQKLCDSLEELLRGASWSGAKDRKMLEDALKLVHEGHLVDVLAVSQRKPQL